MPNHRAKPLLPALQPGHFTPGLVGLWVPTHSHGTVLPNLANYPGGLSTGPPGTGAVSSAIKRTPTQEGPGLALNGTSDYVNCGSALDLVGAKRFSVWVRFILRASMASGTYAGILDQWNDPNPSSVACQRFQVNVWNNVFSRPANSFDINIFNGGSYAPVCAIQYQASDVGQVLTLGAFYDGAICRILGFFPSGLVATSVSAALGVLGGGTATNTIMGRVDGGYAPITILAAGLWKNRVLTFGDFADLHTNPYALVTPRRTAVATLYSPPPSIWGFRSVTFHSPVFHSKLITGAGRVAAA